MIGHPKVSPRRLRRRTSHLCAHLPACQKGARTRNGPSAEIPSRPHAHLISQTTGVDIIGAQGGEGGGHTGDTPFSILIPAVVDLCKGATSPLTGQPVAVVAAGGIADGRGLAAALSYGASGVWVGTRFVASEEAGAPPIHKQLVVSAGYDDTVRTLLYSGRPMSVRKTDYVRDW